MIYKIFFSTLAILSMALGCSNGNQAEADKKKAEQKVLAIDSNVIKVYIDETGAISANGNSISLTDLDSSFSKLKVTNGAVYYSRANGQGEPPPGAMDVLNAIMKYGLSIRLYTDKTFTVIVKPD